MMPAERVLRANSGFIGHTIFWDPSVSLGRLPFYDVRSRDALQTETIQPPLLAWAWRIAVGDHTREPRIARQIDWLAPNRDLDAARGMAAGLIAAVEREGLRERYDPRDGAGLGARDFAWSALITEMADPPAYLYR